METYNARLNFVVDYIEDLNFAEGATLASISYGSLDEHFLFIVYSKEESLTPGKYNTHALMYEIDFSVVPKPKVIYSHITSPESKTYLCGHDDDANFVIEETLLPLDRANSELFPRLDIFYNFLYTNSIGNIDILRKRAYDNTRKILQQTFL